MRWYALCHLGAESALQRELTADGLAGEPLPGACAFEAEPAEAIAFLYRTQVSTRLMRAIAHGHWEDLDVSHAKDLIPEDGTFRVECETVAGGPGDVTSKDIASELGAQIARPVDLKKPQHLVFCQSGPLAIVGVDVAGDLSKRYYRAFTGRHSMKGTFAASMLFHFAIEGDSLLDPFGGTGEIAIEHALFQSGTSPMRFLKHQRIAPELEALRKEAFVDSEHAPAHQTWCFDPQLGALRSCKKNAKLAGVDKHIIFSKLDPEWMDLKFEEKSVSAVATIPTPVTARSPESDHLRELCYQAAFVLKRKGQLVVACLTPETAEAMATHAKTYKLKLRDQHVIHSGMLAVQVVSYGV